MASPWWSLFGSIALGTLGTLGTLATVGACATTPAPAAAPAANEVATPSPSRVVAAVPSLAPIEGGAPPPRLAARAFALPGAPTPVGLDYLAYEPGASRVWVPVGDTGSVDVFDTAHQSFTRVDGFKTAERESKGRKRLLGPSAASVGDGVVYVGDRATGEVCIVDTKTLTLGSCVKLASPTDGVAYVASAREVWVTTPHDQSIAVLDASKPGVLRVKSPIQVEGAPEGYAVDNTRGLFFTNLEDKDRTVVVDTKSHRVQASWNTGCGGDGPRGLAVETEHGFVFVACTDRVVVLDASRDGARIAEVSTGAGLDNIDWLPSRRLLFAGAARAGRLTVAHVDDAGQLVVVATADTPQGARNPVADAQGNAYEADPMHGGILVVPAAGAVGAVGER